MHASCLCEEALDFVRMQILFVSRFGSIEQQCRYCGSNEVCVIHVCLINGVEAALVVESLSMHIEAVYGQRVFAL